MGSTILKGWGSGQICDPLPPVAGNAYVEAGECTSCRYPDQDRVVASVLYDQKCGITH